MRFPPREGPRFRFGGPGPFVVRAHPAIKMLLEQGAGFSGQGAAV